MSASAHILCSPDITLSDCFLFPQMKKVLKGKCFADVGEVKQKMAALKRIKIDEFKNWFEQWEKKVSIGALHQIENTLKVHEV